MELAGFEHLIAEADRIAHYDDQAKRGCLHELISRQLILNKRYVLFRPSRVSRSSTQNAKIC